tara:strand:- start:41090 stop:41344 length:255 start_codon:yes stop_codon:yes gene_type:complete
MNNIDLIECESCNGSGEVVVSCCTGDIIDDDFAMCPECYEHLGEEECSDCGGSGKIEVGTELSAKTKGLQTQAENYIDSMKYES